MEALPDPVRAVAKFEAQSYYGRMFAEPLVLNKEAKNYLNLGSGALTFEDYINIDFFHSGSADYTADLRFPLMIEDAAVDGIFTEHTLEHLTYDQVEQLLHECYRILKLSGTMRIIVPDIGIFAKNYAENNIAWFQEWEKYMFVNSEDPDRINRKMISSMTAISFVTQEYGHVSCWDFEMMEKFLLKADFKNIRKVAFGESSDNRLLKDNDSIDRVSVSLYVEASKE